MSASDFNRQIAAEQSRITALRKEIEELNEEISGLRTFTEDLNHMQDQLHRTASSASGKLQEITGTFIGLVKAFVKQEFFADIQERATGENYRSADAGLDESREITEARIREDKKKVENKQDQIEACRRRIAQLERDKAEESLKEAAKLAEIVTKG